MFFSSIFKRGVGFGHRSMENIVHHQFFFVDADSIDKQPYGKASVKKGAWLEVNTGGSLRRIAAIAL